MIRIAGVGPGNPRYLTVEVREKIMEAEEVIAFGRVGSSIKSIREDFIQVNRVDEVIEKLDASKDVLLLASGDPNFFGIVNYIKGKGIEIKEVLPGLSSFQYMMAKLKKSWQAAKFISLHGRDWDLKTIAEEKLIIALIDKKHSPSFISKEVYKLGLKGNIYVGFNLSYDDEKIIKAKIGDEIEDYSSLGVVVIENKVDKR